MSLKFKKISGSTPYLLNSASTAEELTLALEDYMRTGAQIIFQHDGEDCILTSFEYKSGIESTVIAYFVTPKKTLLKVDIGAGYDLVITESDIAPDIDITWENLQDKPFGEVTENWGGNLEAFNGVVTNPFPYAEGELRFVKVSNYVPTIDDINSGYTLKHIDLNGNEQTTELGEGEVNEDSNSGIILINAFGAPFVAIVPSDNIEMDEIVFPEKGVYFAHIVLAGGSFLTYCKSFSIQGHTFGNITAIKKIDEKYLPKINGGGIIDVDKLPTINIDEQSIYRVKEGLFFYAYNNYTRHGTTYVVDELPETGEPCTLDGETINVIYYERKTNDCYVYVPSSIAPALGVNEGWYTAAMLLGALGYTWGGIVTSLEDMDEDGVFYFLKTPYYGAYSNGVWTELVSKEYVDNAVANAIGNAIGGSY